MFRNLFLSLALALFLTTWGCTHEEMSPAAAEAIAQQEEEVPAAASPEVCASEYAAKAAAFKALQEATAIPVAATEEGLQAYVPGRNKALDAWNDAEASYQLCLVVSVLPQEENPCGDLWSAFRTAQTDGEAAKKLDAEAATVIDNEGSRAYRERAGARLLELREKDKAAYLGWLDLENQRMYDLDPDLRLYYQIERLKEKSPALRNALKANSTDYDAYKKERDAAAQKSKETDEFWDGAIATAETAYLACVDLRATKIETPLCRQDD